GYNADGSLDSSFGNNGLVITDFGFDSQAFALAVQTDGKIVVAGYTFTGGSQYDFALARYNTDGSLDTTFGTNGEVVTDFGTGGDEALAVVIDADGKIVVAGYTFTGDSQYDFALARYNADGSLDTSFGPDHDG